MEQGRTARAVGTLAALLWAGLAYRATVADPTTRPAATGPTTEPVAPVGTSDPRETIRYLASDALAGRLPGSPGLVRAGQFIAAEFDRIGLKPLPGHGDDFQPFPMLMTAKVDPKTALSVGDKPLVLRTDFGPMTSSPDGKFAGPVAFAGYGVTHADADGHVDYDDYAGLDVKGKVVLVMRREPLDARNRSRFATNGERWSDLALFQTKAKAAADHGAVALLVVNPPTSGGPDRVDPYYGGDGSQPDAAVPIVQVTRELANQMLATGGQKNLEAVQAGINKAFAPHSAELPGVTAGGDVVVNRKQADVRNVMGVLPGVGPRKDEWVVVGAHYDHLGRGELGHMMPSRHGRDAIYHGADDNASGTAAVIELAERVAAGGPRDRSVLFVCFTGEEEGLIGSAWFVKHPPIPLDHVAAMLNLDMVGRLREDRLLVCGTGTAPALPAIVKHATAGTDLDTRTFDPGGLGPSDHDSFARHHVPVLFLYTGVHRDYHTPTDTADKINYAGMDRVVAFSQKLIDALVAMPRQTYDATHDDSSERIWSNEAEPTTRPTFGVGLADAAATTTMPTTAPTGASVAEVAPGSPAEAAGVKPGDRIVAFNDKPIADADDLTTAIADAKPGRPISVKVVRDGETLELHATLVIRGR